MRPMGRPKSVWHDLPPRMKGRRLASGKVRYYYQAGGKQIPLGSNIITAKQEWLRLETTGANLLFPSVSKLYRAAVLPSLAYDTRKHYEGALNRLEVYLRKVALEQIEPKDVKAYLRKRSSKGAGMFEKRILSAVFNWARGDGLTSAPNPCHGMKLSIAEKKTLGTTGKRTKYVTDAEFDALHAGAPWLLQDAMDLALLTGQRPSDLFRATRQDVRDGVLWVEQGKTGAKVGIRVQGALATVLERCQKRQRRIQSLYLIADAKGQPLNVKRLNGLWTKARGDARWQFRDIRAKAASDSPDLKQAQRLLGHRSETTTAGVYRRTVGDVVSPLERKKSGI
jgi:integrase